MLIDRIYKFFSSVKLTVVLLSLGLALVFLGTVAQEPLGLYEAQHRFFRSFFVSASSFYAAIYKTVDMFSQGMGFPLPPLDAHELLTKPGIPVFPGGYLLGGLLLVNLLFAHTRYYQPGKRKIGIAMIHLGIVLLLVGQLLTDVLSTESSMHIREGSASNYSEAGRSFELAIIDATDPEVDHVVAIPGRMLAHGRQVTHKELPFRVRAKTYYENSSVSQQAGAGFEEVKATTSIGSGVWWKKDPRETTMDRRDMPSAIIEFVGPQGTLGTYFVSAYLAQPQEFSHGGKRYKITMRLERFYKPFSLHLVDFAFDRYPGTQIPKNYSSRVRVMRPDTGENREVMIYMNNPLRYEGETFYQASFDEEDERGTVLQVVRNPSWLTPYFACVLVSIGLIVQFIQSLMAHSKRRSK
jgi:hypothetical protein